ncbi:GNAT family N-acetyltransferase [Achromobacter xylosoxidans]
MNCWPSWAIPAPRVSCRRRSSACWGTATPNCWWPRTAAGCWGSSACISWCSWRCRGLLPHHLFLRQRRGPRQRRGRALEEAAEALARARGCDRIEVHCHERRVDAHRFYHRQGYAESPKYLMKSCRR